MKQAQTDNSHLQEKIFLRISFLPKKENISVLDCFHGSGVIWDTIASRHNGTIKVTGLDKKKESSAHIVCDNLKYLLGRKSLGEYDAIDLDAYGVPAEHLLELYKKDFHGPVFVTWILSAQGRLPQIVFDRCGISSKMVRKCQGLFRGLNQELMDGFLYSINVKQKTYFYIPENGMQKWYFAITM